jgi:hypothetical protein
MNAADIRLEDANKLLRARLKVVVDVLDELVPCCYPCPQQERAKVVVRGERELMNPAPRLPRPIPILDDD